MPAQGVFKHPSLAFPILGFDGVEVADLARGDAAVPDHGEEVEADLGGVVAGDAPLENVHDLGAEVFRGAVAVAVGDGGGLQAVELVQLAVDGEVGDEVEGVVGLAVLLRLVDKGAALGEAVVDLADELRVAEGLAADVGGEHAGKVLELAELVPDIDFVAVQDDAEEGLGAASVLDGLVGEEDAVGGGFVVGAIVGGGSAGVGAVGGELEEEDDAVYGVEGREVGRVEGEELFELDVFYAEVLEEVCEYALVEETLRLADTCRELRGLGQMGRVK